MTDDLSAMVIKHRYGEMTILRPDLIDIELRNGELRLLKKATGKPSDKPGIVAAFAPGTWKAMWLDPEVKQHRQADERAED